MYWPCYSLFYTIIYSLTLILSVFLICYPFWVPTLSTTLITIIYSVFFMGYSASFMLWFVVRVCYYTVSVYCMDYDAVVGSHSIVAVGWSYCG